MSCQIMLGQVSSGYVSLGQVISGYVISPERAGYIMLARLGQVRSC